VARAIHNRSAQRDMPLVKVNCAAIPENLLESELFGYVRGAFTGATTARKGRFALADGGTIFLDEIGTMSPALQAKLLRVLQEREFEPLGSERSQRVDVRVIAATNRDLRQMVSDGRFLDDLYYRLNVIPIAIPPLRERKEDIQPITETLIGDLNRKHDCKVSDLSPEVVDALEKHNWPGNVRELRNVLERAVILAGEGTVEMRHLPAFLQTRAAVAGVAAPAASGPVDDSSVRFTIGTTVEEAEKGLILRTLEHTHNNKTRAAEILGISLKTLHNKLREYGAGVGAGA